MTDSARRDQVAWIVADHAQRLTSWSDERRTQFGENVADALLAADLIREEEPIE